MSVSASPKSKRALKSIIVWKNKYLIQIKYRLKKQLKIMQSTVDCLSLFIYVELYFTGERVIAPLT